MSNNPFILFVSHRLKSFKEFKNHEKIIELNDPKSGLKGFIAIHSAHLVPALGGTRIFPYSSKRKALKDVLRLSSAMTNKCAVAGVKFGGGKGVIIAKPSSPKIKQILKAYANEINKLKGKFYTGEDVGLSEGDVQYMLNFSPYFIGKSHLAGDPSPYAALSAFYCIKVALKHVYGSDKIEGRKFAIKGVGKTGGELARLLAQEGGQVIIADTDLKKVKQLTHRFRNITQVPVSKIQMLECDVYAPCALGDDINLTLAKKISTKIICGTANNQLTDSRVSEELFRRKILHVPDYIANAGGLINVSAELWPRKFSKKRVLKKIHSLRSTLKKTLEISKKQKLNPDLVADALAKKFISRYL